MDRSPLPSFEALGVELGRHQGGRAVEHGVLADEVVGAIELLRGEAPQPHPHLRAAVAGAGCGTTLREFGTGIGSKAATTRGLPVRSLNVELAGVVKSAWKSKMRN